MTLPQFVHDNNFFVFQGIHFQQIFSCPMASPVSAILTNLDGLSHRPQPLVTLPNGGLDTYMTAMCV